MAAMVAALGSGLEAASKLISALEHWKSTRAEHDVDMTCLHHEVHHVYRMLQWHNQFPQVAVKMMEDQVIKELEDTTERIVRHCFEGVASTFIPLEVHTLHQFTEEIRTWFKNHKDLEDALKAQVASDKARQIWSGLKIKTSNEACKVNWLYQFVGMQPHHVQEQLLCEDYPIEIMGNHFVKALYDALQEDDTNSLWPPGSLVEVETYVSRGVELCFNGLVLRDARVQSVDDKKGWTAGVKILSLTDLGVDWFDPGEVKLLRWGPTSKLLEDCLVSEAAQMHASIGYEMVQLSFVRQPGNLFWFAMKYHEAPFPKILEDVLQHHMKSELSRDAWDYFQSSNMSRYLFVGNPGVGKSTLINQLAEKTEVKAGIKFGGGMTKVLKWCLLMRPSAMLSGFFGDTPGLDDAELRDEAAKEIEAGLKAGQSQRLILFARLEAGRVHGADAATAKVVLDALKEIPSLEIQYSVVFNKIEDETWSALCEGQEDGPPSTENTNQVLSVFFKNLPVTNSVYWLQDKRSWKNGALPATFVTWLERAPILNLENREKEVPHLDVAKFDELRAQVEDMSRQLAGWITATGDMSLRHVKAKAEALEMKKHFDEFESQVRQEKQKTEKKLKQALEQQVAQDKVIQELRRKIASPMLEKKVQLFMEASPASKKLQEMSQKMKNQRELWQVERQVKKEVLRLKTGDELYIYFPGKMSTGRRSNFNSNEKMWIGHVPTASKLTYSYLTATTKEDNRQKFRVEFHTLPVSPSLSVSLSLSLSLSLGAACNCHLTFQYLGNLHQPERSRVFHSVLGYMQLHEFCETDPKYHFMVVDEDTNEKVSIDEVEYHKPYYLRDESSGGITRLHESCPVLQFESPQPASDPGEQYYVQNSASRTETTGCLEERRRVVFVPAASAQPRPQPSLARLAGHTIPRRVSPRPQPSLARLAGHTIPRRVSPRPQPSLARLAGHTIPRRVSPPFRKGHP